MINHFKAYFRNKKIILISYLILITLVLLCLSINLINKSLENIAYFFLALILFTLPILISTKLKIKIPNLLEIIILLFIFAVTILGGIFNFYIIFPVFDKILHTIHGFCCCAVGLGLIEIILKSNNSKLINIFKVILALCFSMTIGVLWEFVEFGCDSFLKCDMQKDRIISTIKTVELDPTNENVTIVLDDIKKVEITYAKNQKEVLDGYLDIGLYDTMGDLIVNFIGALLFSFFAYFYLNNKSFKLVQKLLITKLKIQRNI